MAENNTIPTKEQILTTQPRRIVFDCRMKGMNIKEAAKEAKLSYKYARNLCEGNFRNCIAKCGINELVKREMEDIQAKTREKLQITRETQTAKLQEVIDTCTEESDHTNVVAAIREQNKLFGLSIDKSVTEPEAQRELTPEEAQKAKLWAWIEQNHSPESIIELLQEQDIVDR